MSAACARSERGQVLPEFALVLPLFAMLLFGIFDVGRVVWANAVLAEAARIGAREAIIHGGSATTPCPYGPPGPDAVVPAASTSCPYPSPSTQAIKDAAKAAAFGGGESMTVAVCYGEDCTGETHTGTNARGTPVTVRLAATVTLATGSFLGLGPFTLHADSTMLVNH